MIDLHCHLCFGIDDGPKTAEESVALARALVDEGVTEVACTPHIRPNKGWWAGADVQQRLHDELDTALAEAGVELVRHRGAEHYFDADVLGESFDERLVPYGDGQWLLVELPYEGAPPDLLGPLFRLRGRGYRLVLAHIERYPWVTANADLTEQLLNAGYLLQVNLGSLAGAYTRAHKKAAEKLVKAGQAALVAGDCHRAGDAKKLIAKGRKALTKIAGEARSKRMTIDVPRGILHNEAPEALWP
jgi:protein-tyrosine phosphatase